MKINLLCLLFILSILQFFKTQDQKENQINDKLKVTNFTIQITASDRLGCDVAINETVYYELKQSYTRIDKIIKYLDPKLQLLQDVYVETQTAQISSFQYTNNNKFGYKFFVFIKQFQKKFSISYIYKVKHYLIYDPKNSKKQAINKVFFPFQLQYPYQFDFKKAIYTLNIISQDFDRRTFKKQSKAQIADFQIQYLINEVIVKSIVEADGNLPQLVISFPAININCQIHQKLKARLYFYILLTIIYLSLLMY